MFLCSSKPEYGSRKLEVALRAFKLNASRCVSRCLDRIRGTCAQVSLSKLLSMLDVQCSSFLRYDQLTKSGESNFTGRGSVKRVLLTPDRDVESVHCLSSASSCVIGQHRGQGMRVSLRDVFLAAILGKHAAQASERGCVTRKLRTL